MQNFRIPEIMPLYYNGQKVMTTGQISENLECHCATIRSAFNRHRKNFIEGTDYFYLQKGELTEFKEEQAANYCCTPAANDCNVPFSHLASSLYLWTDSGVAKLVKYLGTDKAKLIYTALKFGYFQPTEQKTVIHGNKTIAPQFVSPREKLDTLKFLIERCTDENLRDDLIRMATNILLDKID